MPLHSAHNAVSIVTDRAFELLVLFIAIPSKNEVSVSSWTMVKQVTVLFNKQFEFVFDHFFVLVSISEELEFFFRKLHSAVWLWAVYWKVLVFNFCFDMWI